MAKRKISGIIDASEHPEPLCTLSVSDSLKYSLNGSFSISTTSLHSFFHNFYTSLINSICLLFLFYDLSVFHTILGSININKNIKPIYKNPNFTFIIITHFQAAYAFFIGCLITVLHFSVAVFLGSDK